MKLVLLHQYGISRLVATGTVSVYVYIGRRESQ